MVKDKWKEEAMCGKLPKNLDKDLSFQWMKHTGLQGETEGLMSSQQTGSDIKH